MNDRYQGLPASTGLGRRPVLAVSGAAGVVLLGGVVAALSGHAPGTAGTGGTAVAAVRECTALAQAAGTLAQVNGGRLVIRPVTIRPVTVSTSGATRVAVSGAPLRDITDGAPVAVAGPRLMPASLSQLRVGATTIAVGHTGPGGVLSAVAVVQPPAGPPGPPGAHVSVNVGDCSSSAIGRALKDLAPVG
jgi:hypothetical protein